jgi:tripartite-type tricarboxylate transporter receptor subunit TctC
MVQTNTKLKREETMPTRSIRLALAGLFLPLAWAAMPAANQAWADEYPSRPIHLIVPFAAGGSADSTARVLAARVGKTIGQSVVVENRTGGGAIIGAEFVNKSEPDGYTLLLGQSGPISINPAVYRNLPYDPIKDFAPVSLTTTYPYVMVVNPALGVKTLKSSSHSPGASPAD